MTTPDELETLIDLGLSLQKPFADRVTMNSGDLDKFVSAVQQAVELTDALQATNNLLIGIRLLFITNNIAVNQTANTNINDRIDKNNKLLNGERKSE